MKKSLPILALLILSVSTVATAQKLAVGQKAPEIRIAEWLTTKPAAGEAQLLHFFHTSSRDCADQLPKLDGFANKYAGCMSVVVVAREPAAKVRPAITGDDVRYLAALDEDGRTFAAFGVEYVPFGVLIDGKGKVLWFGNPGQLDEATLDGLLK